MLPHLPYGRHYNPQFVYFLPNFWKSKTFFEGGFFRKFCPYVRLVFKSGLWSRAGYSGACTVCCTYFSLFGLTPLLSSLVQRLCRKNFFAAVTFDKATWDAKHNTDGTFRQCFFFESFSIVKRCILESSVCSGLDFQFEHLT